MGPPLTVSNAATEADQHDPRHADAGQNGGQIYGQMVMNKFKIEDGALRPIDTLWLVDDKKIAARTKS